jgi:hypothetical protein
MPSLIAELIRGIMQPAVEKKFFGEPFITCARYLGCYEQAYESGAVLGHAFSDRLPVLVRLLTERGHENTQADIMLQTAQKHLVSVGEAKSFFDLAMCFEKARTEDLWRKATVSESDIAQLIKSSRLRLEVVSARLQAAVTDGIGFGAMYPKLTEELWRAAYESTKDPIRLETLRKLGMSIGEFKLDSPPLAQQQEKLIAVVNTFVAKERPELLRDFQQPLPS